MRGHSTRMQRHWKLRTCFVGNTTHRRQTMPGTWCVFGPGRRAPDAAGGPDAQRICAFVRISASNAQNGTRMRNALAHCRWLLHRTLGAGFGARAAWKRPEALPRAGLRKNRGCIKSHGADARAWRTRQAKRAAAFSKHPPPRAGRRSKAATARIAPSRPNAF